MHDDVFVDPEHAPHALVYLDESLVLVEVAADHAAVALELAVDGEGVALTSVRPRGREDGV